MGNIRFDQAIVGAAFLSVAISSMAFAQTTPETMIQQQRQKGVVNVRAEVGVEHDTNVTGTSPEVAALRGLTAEDTLYTPLVNFNVTEPLGRQVVFLTGIAGYVFHQTNKKLDSEYLDLTAGLGNRFGPCGAVTSVGYSRGRNQTDDLTLVATVENLQEIERANLDVTCGRRNGPALKLGASGERATNSERLVAISDYRTTNASAGLVYGRPSVGSATLTGSVSHTEYPNRPKGVGQDGYDQSNVGLTLDRRLGARIEVTLTGAYTHVSAISPPPPTVAVQSGDFSGTTYSGKLSYRASSRLQGQLTFDRAVHPTQLAASTFEVQQSIGAEADYRVGQHISLRLSGTQTDIDAGGTIFLPSAITVTNSRLKILLASMTYQFSKRLSFAFVVEREERTTNIPSFDYVSDRVGLTTDLTF